MVPRSIAGPPVRLLVLGLSLDLARSDSDPDEGLDLESMASLDLLYARRVSLSL